MTPAELAELKAQIKSAKSAHHLLMTGQAVKVFVDQNGERIEYNSVKVGDLASYIKSLEAQLPDAASPYAGPIGFIF